ncbi:MAG: tyrosine-type recombinase/integrase [Nitrososphaerota archaeon]|nr:tyrosine-type recombinase/integrase [Nitrososphaerota archaeon]
MPLDWGREEEFLQSVFLRSHSIHSRRFYWSGLGQFRKFCKETKVAEVNDKNVYDVLNAFVRWNDAKGNQPKTIIDYLCAAKRFLLYQDVSIEENRYRSKVYVPRAMKIEDQPLSVETVRRLLSHGKPNRKMLALILTLASSGMRLAEALNLRVGDLDLGSSPAKIHIKAEYSKTRRER